MTLKIISSYSTKLVSISLVSAKKRKNTSEILFAYILLKSLVNTYINVTRSPHYLFAELVVTRKEVVQWASSTIGGEIPNIAAETISRNRSVRLSVVHSN